MDLQTIFNIIGAGISTCLGWFAKELWNAVKELKEDLAKLREELPKNYVPKEDFRDGLREIKDMLHTISSKIDTKVDK